jgi:hypothetical protein
MTATDDHMALAERFYAAFARPDPRALLQLPDAQFHAVITAGLPEGWAVSYTSPSTCSTTAGARSSPSSRGSRPGCRRA